MAKARSSLFCALVLCVLGAISACHEGFWQMQKDTSATKAAVKQELGLDANVVASAIQTNEGSSVQVRVRLAQAPSANAASIEAKVSNVVRRNFHAPIDTIEVTY
jgi:hypothetical protein